MKGAGVSVAAVEDCILKTFPHIVPADSRRVRAFFVNSDSLLPCSAYFATIKSKDGENERASRLNRRGVFRLNIGLPKTEFAKLFPDSFPRLKKGGVVSVEYDFSRRNVVLPHPICRWMSWICVLNPDARLWRKCAPLLDFAYQKSLAGARKRIRTARASAI